MTAQIQLPLKNTAATGFRLRAIHVLTCEPFMMTSLEFNAFLTCHFSFCSLQSSLQIKYVRSRLPANTHTSAWIRGVPALFFFATSSTGQIYKTGCRVEQISVVIAILTSDNRKGFWTVLRRQKASGVLLSDVKKERCVFYYVIPHLFHWFKETEIHLCLALAHQEISEGRSMLLLNLPPYPFTQQHAAMIEKNTTSRSDVCTCFMCVPCNVCLG